MKIFFAYSVVCFLGAAFLSCSKNSTTASASVKMDNLTASAWVYEDSGIDNDRNGTIDVPITAIAPTLVPSCKIDNTLSFKRDGTGITDEGATKCNSTDLQTTPYNWSFADNETNVTVSNNIFTLVNGKSKIITLSNTQLVLTRDTVIAGATYPMVVNLKH